MKFIGQYSIELEPQIGGIISANKMSLAFKMTLSKSKTSGSVVTPLFAPAN